MKTILLLALLSVAGCGQSGSGKIYPIPEAAISKYVNAKTSTVTTDTKFIVNNSYPIDIALYDDGTFYYDLPNLGDGRGTWKRSGGRIDLKAKRTLFDMYIEVHGTDEEANSLTIQFTDRFGPNTLKMMNVNI